MILKSVSIVNFKNHESLKANFSNSINCFLGNNGVGKTNLLDAIYYLSFCKSYYNSIEMDNVNYGHDFFMLKGVFIDKNSSEFVVNGSLKNKQKLFQWNNKKYDKLSNHIGKVPLVISTPIDGNIIIGGGEERRKFINKFISQLDKDYLMNLISYNRTLKQRNMLLKESNNFDFNEDLMNTYDVKISNFAKIIHRKRKEFVSLILNNVQSYYDIISQNNESISIAYQSELNDYSLQELLAKNREKDRFLKHTSSGVHRDDFVFKINDYSLKKSGSQGQQKTFLIALKFGYFDVLKTSLNITPLLLLDDIFDKLDSSRVEQIIRIINKNEFGQIFITDTSYSRIDTIMDKVNSDCKYFIFDKNGVYEEKFKK